MIYVPNTTRGRHKWISSSQCRWKAPLKDPESWKIFTCLNEIYPAHKRLFCEVLNVWDACLSDVIEEAKSFEAGDSLTHITSIFRAMSKLLEDEQTTDALNELRSLKKHKAFPVSTSEVIPKQANLLSRLDIAIEWFIADTTPLNAKFRGLLPLLDIKVDDLAAMHRLGQKLGFRERFLSEQAINHPRTQGHVEYDEALTDTLRSKVDFIIRMILAAKHYRQRRRRLIQELRNIKVYTANAVIQESRVWYKGKWVKAPAGAGNVALGVHNDDVLVIYLAAKSRFDLGEIELADELFSYCGMTGENPRHSEMCLHVALSQKDTTRIAKLFDDKGIPSLESLKFADVEDSESDEEDLTKKGSRWTRALGRQSSGESSGEGSDRSKKKFRLFGDISVGIVVGLGGLLRNRKCFDGKNESDAWKTISTEVKSSGKEEPPAYEEPQTVLTDHELSESGSNGLRRLGRAVSYRFRQLTTCEEDIAFMGEFKASPCSLTLSILPSLSPISTSKLTNSTRKIDT